MITEKLKASWDSEVDTLLSEEDSVNTKYRVLSGEHTQHMFCPRSSIDRGKQTRCCQQIHYYHSWN